MVNKKQEKALFTQRLCAFIIDVLLVSFIVSLISFPFLDSDNNTKLSKEANLVMEKYTKNELEFNDFFNEYSIISYKMARNSGIVSLLTIFFNVLYFVAFQVYNKGQTFGKKILKIKIESNTGNLTMNQMIFRSMIANFILLDLLSFIFMLICSKFTYFYGVLIFESIQYIVVFISIIMIMFRSDGCAVHDKLVGTKVVRV